MFHLDITKVDRDVALYTFVFKCIFQMFNLFFGHSFQVFDLDVAYVVSVLSGYCICLQWFFKSFQVFLQVFSDACCKCFNCFVRMLQVFYLDV